MRARARLSAMRVASAVVLALGLGLVVPAAQADDDPPRLRVLTRNLYLGADLTPALGAKDTSSFLLAVASIYKTAQHTDFPARAEALAEEIRSSDPDLVGLQEVTIWETSGPDVPPTQDFLTILQEKLADRGLHYSVASVSKNANIGPVPLLNPCGSTIVGACLVGLKDRDVVLVNQDTPSLSWSDARSGLYGVQAKVTPFPGAPAISFDRGWASIEASYKGEKFRFVNTHLETEDVAPVQEAQAKEFLDGPAAGAGRVIAVGDFNSAADGSTTTTYASLTKQFSDAWSTRPFTAGPTCCQSEKLDNIGSQLRTRIDLVLGRSGADPVIALRVGIFPFQTSAPRWASDHAGVFALMELS